MKYILAKYGLQIGLAATAIVAALWIWAGQAEDRLQIGRQIRGEEITGWTVYDWIVVLATASLAALWVYVFRYRFKGPGHAE